jgi:hypothetical protein
MGRSRRLAGGTDTRGCSSCSSLSSACFVGGSTFSSFASLALTGVFARLGVGAREWFSSFLDSGSDRFSSCFVLGCLHQEWLLLVGG